MVCLCVFGSLYDVVEEERGGGDPVGPSSLRLERRLCLMVELINCVWSVVTVCFTDLFLDCNLSFLLYIALICIVLLTMIRFVRGI